VVFAVQSVEYPRDNRACRNGPFFSFHLCVRISRRRRVPSRLEIPEILEIPLRGNDGMAVLLGFFEVLGYYKPLFVARTAGPRGPAYVESCFRRLLEGPLCGDDRGAVLPVCFEVFWVAVDAFALGDRGAFWIKPSGKC
jgi:hypothetical protein